MRGEHIHQRWAQTVVRLQPSILQLLPHIIHLVRIGALLDDAANERGELRLLRSFYQPCGPDLLNPRTAYLPTLLLSKLGMYEIEALERMVLLDATVHVYATFLAGIALNHGAIINHLQLVFARCHLEFINWNNAHDGEQGTRRFPALGAAAGMIVSDVGVELHFHRRGGAVASQRAAVEVGVAFGEPIVDLRVDFDRHRR